ncbi:MAG: aminotransferase class I/II-fold pyridoxal phosphate-dependent enzyme [Propionibacteriaceae bacterium]|nr:aminotransferase class I/II-fold pyridoxal phosphate-dependent enzyme [Micropruina sp.]
MTADAAAPSTQSAALAAAQADYDGFVAKGLKLNMQRGQPSDADFDLSDGILTAVGAGELTMDGIDLRNYPGGIAGLPSARALFGEYLDVDPKQVLVWNNSSLELQGMVLSFALLHGIRGGTPWFGADEASKPTMIVTTPGYDRHFLLLETLGFKLATVGIDENGPDLDAVERLTASDPNVKGILFVPTYSNPTGDTISATNAARLAAMATAAADFTIFADDAYRAHHLGEPDAVVNFIDACAKAGHPERAIVFASTSKITYAGAGLGFLAAGSETLAWMSKYLGAQAIGPNKVEQARHVTFLRGYQGGIAGLMRDHAALIAPKFAACDEVLAANLGRDGAYATWTTPRGGYFSSLDTTAPIASRVVALADAAGVSLTPAGATYPAGNDPHNTNIRIAPTRPEVDDVRQAMEVFAACVKLATEEYRAQAAES